MIFVAAATLVVTTSTIAVDVEAIELVGGRMAPIYTTPVAGVSSVQVVPSAITPVSFFAPVNELSAFLNTIQNLTVPAQMQELVKDAVQSVATSTTDDIDTWAERVAADVKDADD